jgi:hypothetical protein
LQNCLCGFRMPILPEWSMFDAKLSREAYQGACLAAGTENVPRMEICLSH